MAAPRTLFDKIWERHTVVERGDGYTLLYIDRIRKRARWWIRSSATPSITA